MDPSSSGPGDLATSCGELAHFVLLLEPSHVGPVLFSATMDHVIRGQADDALDLGLVLIVEDE